MKTRTLMGRRPRPSSYIKKILAEQPVLPEGETAEHTFQALLIAELLSPPPGADLKELTRVVFEDHDGEVIQAFGAAVVAAFKRPAAAVHAGVTLLRTLESSRMGLRVGVDYGPVARLGEEVFGESIARLMELDALGRAGQMLISESVYQRLDSEFPQPCMLFDAMLGDDAFEIFEVVWRDGNAGGGYQRQWFKPGTRLGDRYEILALLGEGGMGEVYKATDLALDEIVALKFVRPDLVSHPESIASFKDEVKLARALTHPNICRIHEFLQMEGHVFLSMEWVRGRTLGEILEREGGLDGERAERIAIGICQGLGEAHRKGVIHRDLKPSNIMIEAETGRVVLMDFGIAQLAAQASDSDELIGTPEYMSPEQLQGKALTPASDVYALGVLLYELIAGRPPYSGETPLKIGVKHLTERPRPLNPPTPVGGALLGVVSKALKKDPSERFPDASAVATFLGAGPATGGRRRRGRAPVLLMLASVLAGLIATLAVLWPQMYPPTTTLEGLQSRMLVSSLPAEEHARWSPDGEALAFIRGGDLWQMTLGGSPERLTHGAKLLGGEGLQGLAWLDEAGWIFARSEGGKAKLARLSLGESEPTEALERAAAVDVSPDGTRLVFSEPSANRTWSLAISERSGEARELLLPGGASRSYLAPRFSPDGERIALVIHQTGYRSTSDIGVFDLKTRKLRFLTDDGMRRRAANVDPTWTPDGQTIIYASKRSGTTTLWWVSANGGKSRPLTQGATMDQRQPDVSPDGRRIIFNTLQDEVDIELVHLNNGLNEPISRDLWPDRFPVFSPEGDKLAFRTTRGSGGETRIVILYDLGEEEERELAGPKGLRDFDWCTKDQLVYAATEGKRRLLGVMDLRSVESRPLVEGFHRIWSPTCAPSGDAAIFVGRQTPRAPRHLWRVAFTEGAKPQRLTQGKGFRNYPEWSPDGRRVAYRWAPSAKRLGESELRMLDLKAASKGPTTIKTPPTWRRARRRLRFDAEGAHIYFMEARGGEGRLWRLSLARSTTKLVRKIKSPHTFDFDLSPDGRRLVYPRVHRHGDLFVLEPPND